MKCPVCGKKITHVGIYSHCTQRGDLKGNKIVKRDIPEITENIEYNCPECDADIFGEIEK